MKEEIIKMAYQPKSYRKFLAGSVSAALVATAVAPTAGFAASFTDVNQNDSHAEAINALVEAGYIKGYQDGTFKPYNNVTRGQVAKIFARILVDAGFEVPTDLNAFTDVPVNHPDQELVKAAAIVKAAGVMTGSEGKLNPTQNVTRQQMAKVIVKTFGLELPEGHVSKITDLDQADAWAREYIQTLEANGVTNVPEFKPKSNVTRAQFASFAYRALNVEAPAEVKVESVQVIDVNKVEVKFNKAVDTDKVSVALKKGAATHYTVAKWAEDKTSVVLEAPSAIPAGDYDVVVAGLGEEEVKVRITVEAVVAQSIEILNTTIAKQDDAKVSFKVANQYGTDMKIGANDTDLSVQAYNVTQKKTLTVDTSSANSEFTLDLALDTNAKLNDEIRLIVTYKGITVTKTLKVVEPGAVADIELGTAELPKDAKRFTVNTADIKLPYTLKDQYGKELKLTANQTGATIDGVTFLSSDSAIVNPTSFSTDADGNLTFDLGSKAGTVTITAVINSTGDVATTTLKVEEAPKVNAVSISAPTKLVAGGEKAVLDLVVTDQYGDSIKNDDAKVAALTYRSSNQTIVQDANIKLVNGKLEVTTEATGKGPVTISVMSGTTEVGKVTFNVEEKAVATSIVGVETPTLFEDGATSTLTFKDIKVKDQYGRDYTLTAGDKVTVSHKDNTADNVTFAIDGNRDAVLEDAETLTFTGTSSTNNEVITFKLTNGASYDLTVASIASANVTSYSIKPVGTIYAQSTPDVKYDVQLELVGKTSAGKEVVLKSGKVTHATTSDASVATVTSTGVVTGKAKGTATIALWNGATKLAETTVTVSDATPVATKLAFVDLPATVNHAEDLTTYVKITDQYGVDITATELPNGFWTTSDASIATFTGGTVAKVAAGKVTVGFVTSNGLVVTKEVTVN